MVPPNSSVSPCQSKVGSGRVRFIPYEHHGRGRKETHAPNIILFFGVSTKHTNFAHPVNVCTNHTAIRIPDIVLDSLRLNRRIGADMLATLVEQGCGTCF